MKKLILRYLETVDGDVSFKIEEQSHREYHFGRDGYYSFRAKNGIRLSSVCFPAWIGSEYILFCQGVMIDKEDTMLTATTEKWERIKVAVREYNAYFGYPGECILGEIMEDIVPKEMFMVD